MTDAGQDSIDRLRLARTDGVGPVSFRDLLAREGSAAAALAYVTQRFGDTRLPAPQEIERELAAGERLGATLLHIGAPDYPEPLAQIDDPPPVLWRLGPGRLTGDPVIAVVGSRNASAGGQRFARGLASELGAAGALVVSGLARGIDAAAHAGSLTTGTVAVLAGGVDDVFPPENRALYEAILERGVLLSERPPGHRAKARDFIRRNRIVSGLSQGVVVVEAELQSGSLTTARLAGEQGRDVFAVPGSPLEPRARGANGLIKAGALVCESADDVLAQLGVTYTPDTRQRAPQRPAAPDTDNVLLEAIAGLLSPTPISRDELVRATGARAPEVFAALSDLEVAGRAALLPGGMVGIP